MNLGLELLSINLSLYWKSIIKVVAENVLVRQSGQTGTVRRKLIKRTDQRYGSNTQTLSLHSKEVSEKCKHFT